MSGVWVYSIASVIVISLISLIGIVTLSVKRDALKKVLLLLVSFSAGGLLGGAFLHLLPEAAEAGLTITLSVYVLVGILFFFVMEKLIHWRHCHVPTSPQHPHHLAYMNMMGDGVHNFIDGMIIGASYMAGIAVGVATTIAVILHEIPQEVGDFGVMMYAGFSVRRALAMNFITALTAVVGVVISLLIGAFVEGTTMFLLPFAAGGFIYIASSDLIPELHKECEASKSLAHLVMILLGIAVMFAMTLF